MAATLFLYGALRHWKRLHAFPGVQQQQQPPPPLPLPSSSSSVVMPTAAAASQGPLLYSAAPRGSSRLMTRGEALSRRDTQSVLGAGAAGSDRLLPPPVVRAAVTRAVAAAAGVGGGSGSGGGGVFDEQQRQRLLALQQHLYFPRARASTSISFSSFSSSSSSNSSSSSSYLPALPAPTFSSAPSYPPALSHSRGQGGLASLLKRAHWQASHLILGRSRIDGTGLFATMIIEAEDVVAEYTGEIVGDAVGDQREAYYRRCVSDSKLLTFCRVHTHTYTSHSIPPPPSFFSVLFYPPPSPKKQAGYSGLHVPCGRQ